MNDFKPGGVRIIAEVDSELTGKHSHTWINPVGIIAATAPGQIIPVIDKIDALAAEGKYLCGYFSYEACCLLNGYGAKDLDCGEDFPLVWFAVFDQPGVPGPEKTPGQYYLSGPQILTDLEEYKDGFDRIQKYISSGKVYQVNYTTRAGFSVFGDPEALFYDLRKNQLSSYNFLITHGEKNILSLSPELFFYRNRDRIFTRPMKGTIARNPDPALDRANQQALQESPKNRAENAMITDILRNDLGRICQPGSVTVEKYLDIEEYPTLFQMTSTIGGQLKTGVGYGEIFRAMLPAASITGAPKYEAAKKIFEIEKTPRGVYTGVIGIIKPGGEAIFNVAIRTLEVNGTKGRIGIGSGIVHDSRAGEEYEESLLKMSFMSLNKKEFFLFETILFTRGGFTLLGRHLNRLQRSAAYFELEYPGKEILETLQNLKLNLAGKNTSFRIKLILFAGGKFTVEHHSFVKTPRHKKKTFKVALSKDRIKAGNIFNFHKTNLRKIYDEKYARGLKLGFDEVLFFNENDQAAECCVHNIIFKINDKWYTPATRAGLLPGTFREYLLHKKFLVEKNLSPQDIKDAQRVCVINSLRGISEAEIVDRYV